ncbi:MAG: tripartite tricarboxylate transporter substrate binding protein [Burkholderiales bacterium]
MHLPSLAGLLTVTILCTPVAAQAQAFPSRPIEMVIHSNPGAGQDVFGRLFAEITTRDKLLPQPFSIVNRPGGSGAVASTFIKSKRGDPYYLLSLSTTIVLSAAHRPGLGLGLDTYTPVALFGFDLQSITVPIDSKYKTFKELLDAAKREPDSIVNGISSATGTARFLQYQIEKTTGAKFKYVSFKSGSDAMAAVMGKHVDLTMENVSEVLSGVEAKKLRILAVPAEQRLVGLPDVPTLKELGFNIHVGGGRGLAMPAGVPKETLAVMEAAAERAHKSAVWRDYATKNMYENTYMGSAALSQYLAKTLPVVGEFMEFVGIKKPQ